MHYIYRYSTIITFGYEAVSLLPFLSEKHICILFFITISLDSGIKRDTSEVKCYIAWFKTFYTYYCLIGH